MEEQLEVMGARRWAGHSLAAPDSLGQKVEQAHHLQQTEEQQESEEEKQRSHSGGQSTTHGMCVAAKLTHFIKWVWQNE